MTELATPSGWSTSKLSAARVDLRNLVVVVVVALVPMALAAAEGGYFAVSWGWSAIVVAWIAALAASAVTWLAPVERAWLGVMVGLACWIWASWAWSPIGSQTSLEGLRVLVLPLGITAVLLATRASALRLLVGAILFAVCGISIYALTTRLFPDRLGTFDPVAVYRLSTPVGYWNALGIFAAIGLLIAAALAVRASATATRAVSGAVLPVLALTIYFTFSRGSWIALGVGLVAAVALDPRRLQLFATAALLAPAPAVGIWLASRSDALTHQQSQLAQAAHDGHRLAGILVLLAVVEAGVALLLVWLERRVALDPRVRRNLNLLLAVGAALAVAAGLAAAGGPIELAHRAHDAFTAPPPSVNGNLNQRLLSFSGNGRSVLWQAAWDDYKAHPLLGSGAGSYEQYWLQHRTEGMKVRDAHSLYLETLAELGPIGLGLLLIALGTPLVALRRARHHPLGPILGGAYVAFLVHAGVDWDWEVLAVTLTGLFCGAGILIAARTGEERPLSPRVRVGGIAVVLVLMVVAFVGLVGNIELARASSAAQDGKWAQSVAHAKRAESWAPWSSEPWQKLGEAQMALGENGAAQGSFRKAISKSPKDWELWFDLARASAGKARLEALARATTLNPLSPEIATFKQELAGQGGISVVGK